MRNVAGTVLLVSVLVAPAFTQEATELEHETLHAVFDETWAFRLEENPLLATPVGEHAYDDRLPRVRVEDERRRAEYYRSVLGRVAAIDRDRLSESDRISYDMFRRQLRDDVRDYELEGHLMPINADSGFHMGLARLPSRMPLASVEGYEDYIARLEQVRRYFEEHIELMREGLRTGMTVPRVVLDGYEATIESHVVDAVEQSVFFEPFVSFPTTVPEADRDRLKAAGERAIRTSVVPGYRAFLEFMTDEYLPNARESIGASELPNGRAYYAFLVGHFTTMDVTPEEVHRIGLEEVARIRTEMDDVIEEVGFEGDFAEFLTFLRTDLQFYPETADELLKEASFIAKKMDGKLPSLFQRLPRQPYTVAPVPDHMAPKYTAGRYVGAPIDGTEPGTYWVNTYKLDSRTLYTLEALTFHEAVPGHHLQNALRQELTGIPEFRRHAGIGAYGEGWGLYAERLGLEAGFYEDPYSNFGRLTYEMWRACRLVVDTGLHAKGWTRQQAIDYLASHTALSLHEVTTETDRYISWPGQALGYKMGEIEIRKLRARAEDVLGAAFDVREFHGVILGSGPVPLPVLGDLVEAWIQSKR